MNESVEYHWGSYCTFPMLDFKYTQNVVSIEVDEKRKNR